MNSYTIDINTFLLNEKNFITTDIDGKERLIKNVCKAIERYESLRSSWDNAIFFSAYDGDSDFLQEIDNHVFMSEKYQYEIETILSFEYGGYQKTKEVLLKIIRFYQKVKYEKRDFNHQFDILSFENDVQFIDKPDVKVAETYGQNFSKTISAISLLNHFMYDNYDRNLFFYPRLANNEELSIFSRFEKINTMNHELRNIVNNCKELKGVVKVNFTGNIAKKHEPINTLEEAVKKAEAEFSKYLYFGNDVWRGINERDPDAGPPEKVYYYLKTLSEVTGIKRTKPPDWSLVLLAKMYGCDCSSEGVELKKNENLMQCRKFYYGNGECDYFVDHLKPNNNWDKKGIRIHFKWIKNMTVIGWIGKHLPLKEEDIENGKDCKKDLS